MSDEEMTNRRAFLTGARIVVAAAAAASSAAANTLTPATLASQVNAEGRFAGKVVAITGGNSGIGKATADAFAMAGAKVFITARRDALTKAAANLSAKDNIRNNSISPLAVDTPMLEESFAYQGVSYEAMVPNFVTQGTMAAHEMALGVMFLAADEPISVNGMDLDATGAQLA